MIRDSKGWLTHFVKLNGPQPRDSSLERLFPTLTASLAGATIFSRGFLMRDCWVLFLSWF
jgi:hypothetical protein